METILKGIEQGGIAGVALVFAAMWFMEMRERRRREVEDSQIRKQAIRAQLKLTRVLTKFYVLLSQDDAELDGEDATE